MMPQVDRQELLTFICLHGDAGILFFFSFEHSTSCSCSFNWEMLIETEGDLAPRTPLCRRNHTVDVHQNCNASALSVVFINLIALNGLFAFLCLFCYNETVILIVQ